MFLFGLQSYENSTSKGRSQNPAARKLPVAARQRVCGVWGSGCPAHQIRPTNKFVGYDIYHLAPDVPGQATQATEVSGQALKHRW